MDTGSELHHFLYFKTGDTELIPYSFSQDLPIPEGMTRIVAISDTHNQTKNLQLPWGHVLIHAGDVMTESGLRHVERSKDNLLVTVKPYGADLLTKFASWFGAQPHPHKLLVAGNHDWVMQAMGPEKIKTVLDTHSTPGSTVYLEHEEASLGPLKVFGSPHAYWGGHNNAFLSKHVDYSAMTKGTHIMVTHYPALLPGRKNKEIKESRDIVNAIHNSDVLLHVGGHCHWAHGLYFTSKKIPCLVASVCNRWMSPILLSGERGDPKGDRLRGGYNPHFPPIVCDLAIPGGPPEASLVWKKNPQRTIVPLALPFVNPDEVKDKPTLIFFGPNTDPKAVKRLLPEFEKLFNVSHFDDVQEAIDAVQTQETPFDVCVSKLGSTNNLGKDLLRVLITKSNKTFIAVHSRTAKGHPSTQKTLTENFGVQLIVDGHSEAPLLEILHQIALHWIQNRK